MDRRLTVTGIGLLLLTALASCGSEPPIAQAPGKRLTNQGPCDLIKFVDLSKQFDPPEDMPKQIGSQCFYEFKNASVRIHLKPEIDHKGVPIEIEGVAATKALSDFVCHIDVWMVPGDQDQRFSVDVYRKNSGLGEPDCDGGTMVAKLIVSDLPG